MAINKYSMFICWTALRAKSNIYGLVVIRGLNIRRAVAITIATYGVGREISVGNRAAPIRRSASGPPGTASSMAAFL